MQMLPMLSATARDAISAFAHPTPLATIRLHDLQQRVEELSQLPGFHNREIRRLAGQMGGLLLTIHSLDVRFNRSGILARLHRVLQIALEIDAADTLRIPDVPRRMNVIPFPVTARRPAHLG